MILDKICEHKKAEVGQRIGALPLAALQERLDLSAPVRDFRLALRLPGISLISEIKRSSPSRGMMRPDIQPAELAKTYKSGGARALSVLTDNRFFGGSFDDFASARGEVDLPCLQKDFIVSDYQIYEARVHHADCILLIVRILSPQQLRDYLELARNLGMAALVETHSASEIQTAIEAGAHIVGINNRDLDTLAVDVNTTMNLRKLVPGGHVLVSESGIKTRDHVRMLEDAGIDAILVGETLVTSDNIRRKIGDLLGHDKG